jgi:hypothetical protein
MRVDRHLPWKRQAVTEQDETAREAVSLTYYST